MLCRFIELAPGAVDAPDSISWSPLFWACNNGHGAHAGWLALRVSQLLGTRQGCLTSLHHLRLTTDSSALCSPPLQPRRRSGCWARAPAPGTATATSACRCTLRRKRVREAATWALLALPCRLCPGGLSLHPCLHQHHKGMCPQGPAPFTWICHYGTPPRRPHRMRAAPGAAHAVQPGPSSCCWLACLPRCARPERPDAGAAGQRAWAPRVCGAAAGCRWHGCVGAWAGAWRFVGRRLDG